MADKDTLARNPKVWCFTTYFAEGLPYMIVRSMTSVFFTDIGMKTRYLGYLNFLGIPWNLKFLWAPFVEIFGRKRSWMIVVQILITLLTLAVAGICVLAARSPDPSLSTSVLVALFIVMAFIAATNDIAIDGYYMEGIADPKEQAAYTGYRVFAYRMSIIFVKYGLVSIAGFTAKSLSTGGEYIGWAWAFFVAGVTMGLFTLYHIVALPRFEVAIKSVKSVQSVAIEFINSFATYLDISTQKSKVALSSSLGISVLAFVICNMITHQIVLSFAFALLAMLAPLLIQARGAVAISLIFIIFYKIGDEILFSMGTPFLMRELHVSLKQIGLMAGVVGAFGSIAGTSIGGIWIKKTGLKKAIWPLTIIMNFNIWAYVWLAWAKPDASSMAGIMTIGAVYCYEQIAAGLGNAVLIVFILRTCKPQFKAAHYAIGSAFMSLFSTIFGGFGGVIVERMGYLNLFILSFLASIPAMALMFAVKIEEDK